MSPPLLLMPYKPDAEREAVARAWQGRGWEVLRLDRFWEPPELDAARVRIYGGTAFAHVLAQKFGVELVSPADDLILALGPQWTSRRLTAVELAQAAGLTYPAFVKPLVPKLFDAGVFESAEALAGAASGLEPDTRLLVSELVQFTAEYRCWCWQGRVLTRARYEGTDAADPAEWVLQLLRANQLLEPLVVDVGLIPGQGWAVVEFNACWGAGLNGADAVAAVDCIAAATRTLL